MTLVEDLQAFVKEESLPTPRWPRQHVLKFNQTEIKLEAALAGIMVLSARAISTPTDHQSDFSWNKSWIHHLHQAGILNTSETTPAAERIAATLFNKLKDLYVWRWVASKAPPAAQTSRCTTDHADLAAPTSLPASAPTEEGPSRVQPSADADRPTSENRDSRAAAAPLPAQEVAARPRRQRATAKVQRLEEIAGSPELDSRRSKSPVSTMPPIPRPGNQKIGALCLSTSDILTPKSTNRKRPAEHTASGRRNKLAKQGGKPAALKTCPTCSKVQPGARQKKCACGHNFQAAKDAVKEQKNAKKARDKWPALKVFNQACNSAEAACLHNPSVLLVVYAAVPQHDADKMKGGFTAQARGFGMLGKEVAKKAGKTFIQSSQLAASYLLDKAKKAEKKDTDTQEGGTTYTNVDDFLQQNDLSAIKDHLPPRLSLDLLKYINQEQMKKWEIDNIFWGKLMKCAQRISP